MKIQYTEEKVAFVNSETNITINARQLGFSQHIIGVFCNGRATNTTFSCSITSGSLDTFGIRIKSHIASDNGDYTVRLIVIGK